MREFRAWVKLALFLSSYIPFFAIMAVKNTGVTLQTPPFSISELGISVPQLSVPWVTVLFVILSFIAGYVLFRTLQLREKEEPKPVHTKNPKRRNDLLTSYVVAYVFPFINLDYALLENWIALLIFFGVLAAIQIQSNQLHINPILAASGYNIYEFEDSSTGHIRMAIVPRSQEISPDEHISAVPVGPDIYIAT